MQEIKSPCNNSCNFDYIKKFCAGCYRTMAEIVSWPALTNEEKLVVLQRAESRKKADRENGNSRYS